MMLDPQSSRLGEVQADHNEVSDTFQPRDHIEAHMTSYYSPPRLPLLSSPSIDFSNTLPNNTIMRDALADVTMNEQAQSEQDKDPYYPRPVIVHTAPAVVPDSRTAQIENRLQASSMDRADLASQHFGRSDPSMHHRASAVFDDTMQLQNTGLSRPTSELYLPESSDMGAAFHIDVMRGADERQLLSPGYAVEDELHMDRPRTPNSTDTYHQAQTLFTDFDGAHYAPSVIQPGPENAIPGRRLSSGSMLMAPFQLANQGLPPPAPGMVYYPAPVPKTLLLPQRLSRAMPAAEQAKRRSQMLSALPEDARKSAIWLNKNPALERPEDRQEDNPQAKQRISLLPPQLRASMYFENPSQLQEVEIRDKSAVATLEDLLDLSTTAPVSAFTDHPIAGNSGPNIYRQEHKRNTSKGTPPRKVKGRSSILGLRHASITSNDALNDVTKPKKHIRAFSLGAKLDSSALGRDESGNIAGSRSGASTPGPHLQDEVEEAEEDEDDPDFDMPSDDDDPYARIGPPTTLLAELQHRKALQKTRNRTALTAFPNGMHATLLEMDAVAQIQKKKRQNARVTLAWEDPDRAKASGFGDDDDVPLGILQAGKNMSKDKLRDREIAEWDQPMGLIQMREREDSEPLAVRKLRLRGLDPNAMRRQSHMRSMSGPLLQVNGDALAVDDEPEETLAQRVRRLKVQSNADSAEGARPVSQALSEELAGQSAADSPRASNIMAPEDGEEEETLRQRRARLQREAQQQNQMQQTAESQPEPVRPALRTTPSMADLLHNVPVGATRRVSDKDLVSNLPQDSLLRQSEEKKAARREMMNGIRNAQRAPSGNFGGKPLLDMSGVNMSKHGIAPTGFRGGHFNNGYGGVGASQAMSGSMIDLQQSMAMIAQQNQVALQMMQQNAMVGMQGQMMPGLPMPGHRHMSMQMPMQQPMPMDPRMSMQMHGPQQNSRMSLQPPVNARVSTGPGAQRMSMNPYNQTMGGFASTPNLMGGMGIPMASTTNLMGGLAVIPAAPAGMTYSREQTVTSMPVTNPPVVADGALARIENWRHEVPLQSASSTST